ncbi:MAG: Sec-independent protein translocase subunit TatA [Gemmatimonadota bacterium]
MGLFDSPWHILILLVVVLLLFGAKRLPGSARSLGQAMRIFKAETRGLREEDQQPNPAPAPPQQLAAPAPAPASTAEAQPAEAQRTNQPG